ncbi:MAG: single-stranded DNA-binding protein [Spirochaetales bacterium]|nr:single-stranded DNA-binding protein [Spirochaetales bacterium]
MATDINCVVLVGRLTQDAEVKYTNSGIPVGKVRLAVNTKRKKDGQWTEEGNFFDIVIWGKFAEALQPYLLKGKAIGVQGELRQNRWEQDGQPRSKVEIVANNVQLLSGKSGTQGSGNQTTQAYTPQQGGEVISPDNFEDDIPF